jgi:hypothetical protein
MVIFQQDGAPPHWGRIVPDYLHATFPNLLTRQRRPTCLAFLIPRHYTSRLLSVGLC